MGDPITARRLSKRFREALSFAAKAHEQQGRKGTDTPYVAHLLAVTGIVLEFGGDEDQAIAAVLHDAVEDQGGAAMLAEIRDRFGDRVAMMVEDCTDADEVPKPPWLERKRAYVEHVAEAHRDSLLVSMADKAHNAASIVRDLRRWGPDVFDRFTAGPTDTAWYYRALVEAFRARGPVGNARDLLQELTRRVEELEQAVAELD